MDQQGQRWGESADVTVVSLVGALSKKKSIAHAVAPVSGVGLGGLMRCPVGRGERYGVRYAMARNKSRCADRLWLQYPEFCTVGQWNLVHQMTGTVTPPWLSTPDKTGPTWQDFIRNPKVLA